MVAGGFRVDLTTLDEAASGVSGTIDMVAQQPVSKIPFERSAAGDDHVAGSLSDFLSGWQRGVNNLVKDGQHIAGRLVDAADAYRKADHNAQEAAGGIFAGTGRDPGVR